MDSGGAPQERKEYEEAATPADMVQSEDRKGSKYPERPPTPPFSGSSDSADRR